MQNYLLPCFSPTSECRTQVENHQVCSVVIPMRRSWCKQSIRNRLIRNVRKTKSFFCCAPSKRFSLVLVNQICGARNQKRDLFCPLLSWHQCCRKYITWLSKTWSKQLLQVLASKMQSHLVLLLGLCSQRQFANTR